MKKAAKKAARKPAEIPTVWGVPCKLDENFNGSIWDKMGMYSHWICPHCESHLTDRLVCLNACQLTAPSLKRFNAMLSAFPTDKRAP